MGQKHEMRRAPQQGRSQERVKAILDAAAQLFAEVGYEAATTNAIAQRAETRIGSLYHFFPNKEAILRALAEEYLQDIRDFSARVFASEEAATIPLPEFIDGIINALLEFDDSHIAFKQILDGAQAPDYLGEVSRQVHQSIIAAVEQGMRLRVPQLAAPENHAVAVIAFSAVKSILNFEAEDAVERQRLLHHLKWMLTVYLTSVSASVS
jgi:AcrR family transcriptional regulator